MQIENKKNYKHYDKSYEDFYTKNKWNAPTITCFKSYIIFKEKNNKIKEAIEMCDLAINLGYDRDGTKGGIKSRKGKLLKKYNKGL